jgi:hypothetical protein
MLRRLEFNTLKRKNAYVFSSDAQPCENSDFCINETTPPLENKPNPPTGRRASFYESASGVIVAKI